MTNASSEASLHRTLCVMDCPDTCSLEVQVEGDHVVAIRGSHRDPVTAGFICSKIARFARRLDHPERILHPLRRTGAKGSGKFERVPWQEALAIIVERFESIRKTYGGEAIVPFHYGGSNGFMTDDSLDLLFFARLGASRLAKTYCAVPTTAVARDMYGKMPGTAYEDYVHARFILLWGANPRVSHIHLVPFLREARARGAFLAVVDPRRLFSEGEADLHLPVRPGTDLPVALAMIHFWHENRMLDWSFLNRACIDWQPLLKAAEAWPVERAARVAGVSPAAIVELARRYAAAEPAVLRCGWGLERNRNGGRAVAAILAMPALLGKFGQRGGGYTMSNSSALRFNDARLLGEVSWQTRVLNMSQIGRLLNAALEPPIKALFVYNANPAVTAPNQRAVLQGLARDDLFTVVHEQVMTDTARYADVVLPATTFLEHYEVKRGYGNYVAGLSRPIVTPRGEACSNDELFRRLAAAFGFDDQAFQWDSAGFQQRLLAALEPGSGVGFDTERVAVDGFARLQFADGGPVQFRDVFPGTPDGRIHLTPACLGEPPYHFEEPDDGRWPLALITPASPRLISSSLGEYNLQRLVVELHPHDAAARRIANGDRVRVLNDLGEVVCYARVNDALRPGVAAMPKGAWRRHAENGYTAAALCPDHVNIVEGAACFNDARVEIEKA